MAEPEVHGDFPELRDAVAERGTQTVIGKPEPVIVKTGGPYVCKTESPKKYFGILAEVGSEVPRCPNCKKACTPVKES